MVEKTSRKNTSKSFPWFSGFNSSLLRISMLHFILTAGAEERIRGNTVGPLFIGSPCRENIQGNTVGPRFIGPRCSARMCKKVIKKGIEISKIFNYDLNIIKSRNIFSSHPILFI